MDKVLTPMVTSVSDFRSDISGTIRRSHDEPFAVLNNNKPSFYVLSPSHYEQIVEILADMDLANTVRSRLDRADRSSVPIDIADL